MGKTLMSNVTGECNLYRDDKFGYPVYCAKLAAPTKEGAWKYAYIQIRLPSGHEVKNDTRISINKGFLSFFRKQNGTTETYIQVLSYDVLNQNIGDIDIPTNNEDEEDTELPF